MILERIKKFKKLKDLVIVTSPFLGFETLTMHNLLCLKRLNLALHHKITSFLPFYNLDQLKLVIIMKVDFDNHIHMYLFILQIHEGVKKFADYLSFFESKNIL